MIELRHDPEAQRVLKPFRVEGMDMGVEKAREKRLAFAAHHRNPRRRLGVPTDTIRPSATTTVADGTVFSPSNTRAPTTAKLFPSIGRPSSRLKNPQAATASAAAAASAILAKCIPAPL